ncbi:B-box zinc finger family protein [Striga asiatica]|uniref:B-box zinc finger family protein n=1 Tax=Striga asiatica TaxID=4170 RepID=A0A5A7PJL4_STRAF|nr:B-box zinc finger family protein [Striga asiatica]
MQKLDNHTYIFGSDIDLENKTEESSPFSQLENVTSSVINPLQGDSFWPTNEIWLQNMQELGVYEEVKCFDASDIPDVDLTFRNFEEFFGNEHDLCIGDDENMSCSFGELDTGCLSKIEEIAGSSSPVNLNLDVVDNKIDTSNQVRKLQSLPFSYDLDNTKLEVKAKAKTRCKETKVVRREKQAECTSPKYVSERQETKKRSTFEGQRPRKRDCKCNDKAFGRCISR